MVVGSDSQPSMFSGNNSEDSYITIFMLLFV